MAKKMLIDATHAEETRIVVADGTKVDDFDFETLNKRQLAGNIYLAKVTRVEPSLQAAFVEYGGNRHGFLAFAEIHPDYYQIPAADRQALIEEDRAEAEAAEAEEGARERRGGKNRRGRGRGEKAERAATAGEVTHSDVVPGMEIIDAAEAVDEAVDPGFAPTQGDAPEAAADDHGADDNGADDHGADHPEDEIESVAEEDVVEEIRAPRKSRARRYKIQEVIKVRQIMLVQVVKEERGNKGAALTTYLSLAGRYCVLMPNTARGGGISRKITNVADRKKLKEIASDLEVPQGAGLIIRTAGSQRTKTEIRRDYEYLMRLWEQIRELTFKSTAPAPIYEEGDLIKRSIRDLYSKDIDEVLVEGERGYRTAKDFMAMIMPGNVRNVKHYTDPMPLFARYQVESYLGGMFNPVVQLKSGGYIVIGITEALVAIDVNSGRATKEGSIEDTAYKTNCEAADEIARQLRLRDLAGLIVVDFIDMDERKNNAAVEKRFKEALKNDRARIQVGRISGFGLMEMSRQRLRPGMLESTTQPCAHCHGTGLIRSDDSMALTILRAIEEEGTRKRSREVLIKAPVAVANFLMNQKREHIGMIETRYGLSVRVEADPMLISPDYALEKFKTAIRTVPESVSVALSVDASLMARIDEAEDAAEEVLDIAEADAEAQETHERATRDEGEDSAEGRGRRRRRRRRGRNGEDAETNRDELRGEEGAAGQADTPSDEQTGQELGGEAQPAIALEAEAGAEPGAEGARPRRRSRSRRRKGDDGAATPSVAATTAAGDIVDDSRDVPAGAGEVVHAEDDLAAVDIAADGGALNPDMPIFAADAPVAVAAVTVQAEDASGIASAETVPAPKPQPAPDAMQPQEAPGSQPQPAPEPALAEADSEPEPALEAPTRAKRRGWWSLG